MSEDNRSTKSIAELRREYSQQALAESEVCKNPIDQFSEWFEQAYSADLLDVNAMNLSTATKQGKPSSRIVLLKGVDEAGFRFYTNYESRKGRELNENPHAALCFYWAPLERQVRIEGEVERLSRLTSEAYFKQRPRESRLGAWASKQSDQVSSREELEKRFRKIKQKFKNEEIPLPDFWGGFLLRAHRIEFWQGRKGRMHDRICYEKSNAEWNIFRLAP
ncbi:pyridoxamine 5'-phosphate oxidase [Aliifodinibius salipaludis]|uniref:Pyridoxamine 5'-phosphate oxidase n=1 Tax=Fodinibius salipaludis TaxID=2032627 RepID=A0A2A2G9N6_9BACT|nr:pyridoxamine 5'-phosphate oxidase [Aliifodinibius salipaludis]PAU93565.1 pyridoxamine 5'-phosphate oxidase [Aliifodinibius salipaludis]